MRTLQNDYASSSSSSYALLLDWRWIIIVHAIIVDTHETAGRRPVFCVCLVGRRTRCRKDGNRPR